MSHDGLPRVDPAYSPRFYPAKSVKDWPGLPVMVRLRLRAEMSAPGGTDVEKESPLDLLLDQIRWAEAERQAAEEELKRTPGWRFRERARRRRRFERRIAEKQQAVAFAVEIGSGIVHSESIAGEKSDD